MTNEYLEAMADDFDKVVTAMKQQMATVRTGRASPALIEGVQVNVASYGAVMPLNQLASISAPDARLLVANPWDKGTIGDIEKAIMASGLGLNPASDGQVVRVPIPPLTGERRQDLVKAVKKMTEDCRVRARHVRRDYNDLFKGLEADGDISQDDLKRILDNVQKATDDCIATVEGIGSAKEQEVLEV